MAGNIVKWWKHKILGGYKQFTVLQECATDSEELIYPGRAPSACSAPPDLLLTSDREQMLKVKSSSSSAGAGTGQTKASHHHHQHQHHQQQQQHHHNHHHQPSAGGHLHQSGNNGHLHTSATSQHHKAPKDAFRKCSGNKGAAGMAGTAGGSGGGGATNTINTTAATIRSDPDRVRLEEFTCDVSLEDGKKPQPLQFSFTLYDLDGHGKITKDDIAGIVSTIYESIGKSVVVPHYGSKTINVRLTVSPDGKTAATKSAVKKAIITPRRRGYRSRKLISDDDGSDTSENCPRMLLRNRTGAAGAVNHSTGVASSPSVATNNLNQTHHHHHHHGNGEAIPVAVGSAGKLKESNLSKAAALTSAAQGNRSTGLSKSSEAATTTMTTGVETTYHNNLSPTTGTPNNKAAALNNAVSLGKPSENVYESINNLKCCNLQQQQQTPSSNNTSQTAASSHVQSPLSVGTGHLNHSTASTAALICRDCIDGPMVSLAAGCHLEPTVSATALPSMDAVVIPTSAAALASGAAAVRSKRKLVRKTRSSRKMGSGAVGGKLAMEDFTGRPRARSLSVGNENCYENVIGRVAAAAPGECWKSSLCRRELIEIIRESMVKNSLCFQPNRKAMESSPKHRHRSHTIASRVGDQVFLNYHHHPALLAANGALPPNLATELAGGTHIAAANTALVSMVAATGHEANLCGYDSYLHQTICAAANGGGGNTTATAIHLAAAAAHTTAAAIQPLTTSTPNRMLHHHHSKAKRKEHRLALATTAGATAAIRSSSHPAPVKLSTALLNQQYPNLSAEQKLTRSINQVEQWLDHRSPKVLLSKVKLADDNTMQLVAATRTTGHSNTTTPGKPTVALKRSKSKEELIPPQGNDNRNALTGDLLLLENLKISEDIAEIAVVTPKKVYNKESLIASATKKNIKTHHQRTTEVSTAAQKGLAAATKTDQVLVQLQYGSVPVNADPSECENLIRMSDDGEDELSLPQPSASARPQQSQSPHHHQQQSQSQPQSPQHSQQQSQQQRYCGTAAASGAHSVSSASATSTTAVHRYVHEHIHHHYHHFENDPDES
ncbi:protein naked cuticle homolog [Anopheles ziemanni]|uniref:protein naked cuticle homolog n=1 Tax=Anopheles coustani TaxID=139045 RepID=UPI002658BCB0|nr:protein naked cuticle homolog [Anopheles coustani]XP_058178886.1 protein naked cuticle homolog [Anopheles ziemanni]